VKTSGRMSDASPAPMGGGGGGCCGGGCGCR
jgi:hypothetical protein